MRTLSLLVGISLVLGWAGLGVADDASAVAEARALLTEPDLAPRAKGVRDLGAIGTREALEALLPVLEDHDLGRKVFFAFLGARKRSRAIAVMERALRMPDVAVGYWWMLTRAGLDRDPEEVYGGGPFSSPFSGPPVVLEAKERAALLDRLAGALPVKRRGVMAPTLRWLVALQHHSPHMAPAAARAWTDLDRDTRSSLLGDEGWPLIKGARMATVLPSTPQPGPHTSWRGDQLRSLALKRLVEMGSKAARAEILADMRRPSPRLNHHALLALEDTYLPELSAVWAKNLRDRPFRGLTALSHLVERYGTPQLLSDVRAVYAESTHWTCEVQAPLVGYLLKHDPAQGLRAVKRAMARRGPKETGCYRYLLEAALPAHWSPAVEALALGYLGDSDRAVRISSAMALIKAGSPAAVDGVLKVVASLPGDHGEEGPLRFRLLHAFVRRTVWMSDAKIKAKLLATISVADRSVLVLAP